MKDYSSGKLKIYENEKTGFRVYNAEPIELLETTQEGFLQLIEDCEKVIEASRKSGGHNNRRTYLEIAVFDAKYGGKSQRTWSPEPKDSYIK
tara:strand:+ start:506 stop:781 length:276 start_codon:yes stop_codon:yes gene_type:complete